MKATFGDEIVRNIGDNHEAITNTKNQMKCRELCCLADPGRGSTFKLFEPNSGSFEKYVDLGHHKPAKQHALIRIFKAFKFSGPFDTKTITMDTHKMLEIKDVVSGYRRLTKT